MERKEKLAACFQKYKKLIDDKKLEQFLNYYDLLIEWNAVMNLTAITDFDEVLKKHFVDSLSFIKAKDIIGAIGALTGIKSEKIGHIEVGDNSSTIEVSKEYVFEVLNAFNNGKIKGKEVHII